MAKVCVLRDKRLTFEVVLDGSITLSDLVKKHTKNISEVNHITAKIIIPKDCTISIIDDLADFGIIRSELHFIVKENAHLNYTCAMVRKLSCCSTKCAKACNCPVLGVDKTIKFTLKERGAHAEVNGTCYGRLKRKFAFKTIQEHCASDTFSNVFIKGVLTDEAVFMSDNLVRVEKGLQNVYAHQMNKNLLLNDKARVVSIPKLEVKSKKVNCSHGAAISTLRDEQLLYLQARGISPQLSRLLLIDAFLT